MRLLFDNNKFSDHLGSGFRRRVIFHLSRLQLQGNRNRTTRKSEGRFSVLPKPWEIQHVRRIVESDCESHNGKIQKAPYLAIGSTPSIFRLSLMMFLMKYECVTRNLCDQKVLDLELKQQVISNCYENLLEMKIGQLGLGWLG